MAFDEERNVWLDEWLTFHKHSYPYEGTNHYKRVAQDRFLHSKIASLMQYNLFNTGWTL